jgi:hypothetical protein
VAASSVHASQRDASESRSLRHDPHHIWVHGLERAAEIKILDGPQHDADLKAAKAVREILKGFDGSNEGVALIGSVCVLKYNGRVVATTLTQEQLAEVRKNPSFLSSPMLMEGLLKGESEYEILMQGNGRMMPKADFLRRALPKVDVKRLSAPKKKKARKAEETRLPKR